MRNIFNRKIAPRPHQPIEHKDTHQQRLAHFDQHGTQVRPVPSGEDFVGILIQRSLHGGAYFFRRDHDSHTTRRFKRGDINVVFGLDLIFEIIKGSCIASVEEETKGNFGKC